jgi:hypothetical protein
MFILAEMNIILESLLMGGSIPLLLITYIFILEKVKTYKAGRQIVDLGVMIGSFGLFLLYVYAILCWLLRINP